MRSITLTQTGSGNSTESPMNLNTSPFNVGFGVVVSGTITYSVQHTFDGINWFNHPTIIAQTTNQDGNYAFPVLQIRLAGLSGTGTATMTLIQAGIQ